MTTRIFKQHGTDWSRVPRPEAPCVAPQGYGSAAARGDLERHFPSQVLVPVTFKPQLSVGLAYVLWRLLGLFGAHYFYMGKIGVGVIYLLTGGLLGVGWVIDVFTLKGQVERVNART